VYVCSGRKYSYSRKDLGNRMDASDEASYWATTKAHASVTCHLGIWAGDEVLTVFWSAKPVIVVANEGVLALVVNWLTTMHFYSS
nr:B3 domain-containing protein [Tanacetum cinerariifolium]